jgi:hypothetical protein
MLGLGHAYQSPYVIPDPDGTIAKQDRAQYMYCYYGIELSGEVAEPFMRTRLRYHDVRRR